MAVRSHEDAALCEEREDMEHSLLWQVENVAPPAPSAPPPVVAPSLAPVAPPVPYSVPELPQEEWLPLPGTQPAHSIHILKTQPLFRQALLSRPVSDCRLWLHDGHLPLDLYIPPP